jgi:hypothetical protein
MYIYMYLIPQIHGHQDTTKSPAIVIVAETLRDVIAVT